MPKSSLHSVFWIAFLVAIVWCPASARELKSIPVANAKLPLSTQALGQQPDWVFRRFGVPAITQELRCCRFFGYRSGASPNVPVLAQTYNLASGGRLAFIYDRLAGLRPWIVVGVAYDSYATDTLKTLRAFFVGKIPRTTLQFVCYDRSPSGPARFGTHTTTMTAEWNAIGGKILYVRYLTDAAPTMHYDPAAGQELFARPQHLDGALSQFGYFSLPVGAIVGLSFEDDTDFSISIHDGYRCF